MMRAILTFCATLTVLFSVAQSVQTRYYRDRYGKDEVPQSKAKYSETVENLADGSVSTTLVNLKSNKIESREVWKGKERVGKWVGWTGRGPQEMDYDFTVEYTQGGCPSDGSTSSINDFLADNKEFDYIAPQMDGEKSHMDFIRKNLRYPANARRSGVQGTVEMILTITEEGKVQDVKVTGGVDKEIDKEAVRVIRALKFSSPPKLNGLPKRICMKMPIRFKLA